MHSIFLNPGNLIMSFIYKSQRLMPAALKCIINVCCINNISASQGFFFSLKFHCLLIFNIGERAIWGWPDFSSLQVTCFSYLDLLGFFVYSWYSKVSSEFLWILASFHSFCLVFNWVLSVNSFMLIYFCFLSRKSGCCTLKEMSEVPLLGDGELTNVNSYLLLRDETTWGDWKWTKILTNT